MSAIQLLDLTLEYLSRPGVWAQGVDGVLRSRPGMYRCECLDTAMTTLFTEYDIRYVDLIQAQAAIAARITGHSVDRLFIKSTIWEWNDAPGRTLDEVLDLIRRAKESMQFPSSV